MILEHRDADRVLAPREVGCTIATGPIVDLGNGRWSVAVLGYMDKRPLGERVLVRDGSTWKVEKAKGSTARWDEQEEIFGSTQRKKKGSR